MAHLHGQEKNPYEALCIHDYEACDVNKPISEMEQWSILSTQMSYVQYDKYTNGNFKLVVRAPTEKYSCKVYEKFQHCERTLQDLNFNQIAQCRKEDYFEAYNNIQTEILYSVKFNKNKDLSTTYLGKKTES